MGRIYTTRGIELNNLGSITGGQALTFGTENNGNTGAIYSSGGTDLQIECLGHRIKIQSDNHNVELYAGEGTVEITMGSTTDNGIVRFLASSAGGTVAELDGSGNLLLAGTLGTGIAF